ncbi:SDR family NAD(P)-dependent oxidoreductase [Edaphobacter sp. HDX4]|uniref:SDR family NAD(P)-dependent oxidoreductase n=1 Tax=Edaphobacter sp. HDX4 TaxID=2794064 RepID=UPI002FE615CD
MLSRSVFAGYAINNTVHLDLDRTNVYAVQDGGGRCTPSRSSVSESTPQEGFHGKDSFDHGSEQRHRLRGSPPVGTRGLTVLLGARDVSRGEEAANKLLGEGLDVRFVAVDLNRASESAVVLAKQIGEEFRRLDVLVNNAAIFAQEDGHLQSPSLMLTGRDRGGFPKEPASALKINRSRCGFTHKSEVDCSTLQQLTAHAYPKTLK